MFLFCSKRLVHQGILALEAVEAGFMPVAVLIRQILAVSANGFFALLTGVGIKIFITFHTVGAVLLQDVLFTK